MTLIYLQNTNIYYNPLHKFTSALGTRCHCANDQSLAGLGKNCSLRFS
uniref:Uncharacterized protein n=1 Tax=Anguilla anguilla TaxID=7936 RepID=A0A0E9STJ2_ANGAN